MRRKCPHSDIRFCPLYVAAHGLQTPEGEWLGCDDGKLEDGHCAVDRGMNYAREVAKVKRAEPGLVEALEFKEVAAEEWAEAERRRGKRQRMLH
ncbi:hypothetical protein ACO34A_13170 [Rhizobium sp. ACO-34A]|nr:hypothetical protein [Rhizobium sp. ACO-34A]ATN34751.1 hypothetical protein ACO34A_13170 [Rhizobium sp. ACO-34A]